MQYTYDERVLDAFENLLLVLDVVDVLALDDVSLLHGLDRVLVLLLSLDPADSHVTERTYKWLATHSIKADIVA